MTYSTRNPAGRNSPATQTLNYQTTPVPFSDTLRPTLILHISPRDLRVSAPLRRTDSPPTHSTPDPVGHSSPYPYPAIFSARPPRLRASASNRFSPSALYCYNSPVARVLMVSSEAAPLAKTG